MNDEQDLTPLTPDDEARIRALLADLGAAPDAASMPPEVAARLDRTVARLVAERADAGRESTAASPEEPRANVVPLRRRWATRAAAAAAAVIVVGAGGVAVANLGVFGGSAANDSAAGGSTSKAESLQDTASAAPSTSPLPPDALSGRVPAVGAASFDRDVARLLSDSPTYTANGSPADLPSTDTRAPQKSEDDSADGALRATGCSGPRVTGGAMPVPVRYDGRLAVLVIHPQRGGDRLVEAWTCSGSKRLDSTRVPVTDPASGQGSPGNPGLGTPSPSP
jgi:hypothetical protein